MNWKKIFISKKLWQAIKIESKTLMLLIRYGMPSYFIQYFGGIGDDLLCTTVAKEIVRRNPAARLWMISRYSKLFLGNKDISRVLNPGSHWYLWYSPMLQSRRLYVAYTNEKYIGANSKDDVSPSAHILTVMCKKAGIQGEIELKPYFYLTEEEKRVGRHFTHQIAIQCIGEESGSAMLNKLWPTDRFQAMIDKLRKLLPGDSNFIQLGESKDHLISGVTDFRGKTTIRETAAILSQSVCFIGTVGFLMHLARAVDCRSVIIYGGREHSWQSGYSCNENLNTFIECAPCWKWNECDFERRCMRLITVEMVVDAIKKILSCPNTVPADKVII